MNYGAIGFIIGHEITHGFDDMGRQYDFDGNLRDWWQSDTANHFIEKAQCIIEQYGNYTDPATKLMVRQLFYFLYYFVICNSTNKCLLVVDLQPFWSKSKLQL